ncbi:hypothetical protein DFP72DRAFT_761068, partial [Ephemerocybe angulata]
IPSSIVSGCQIPINLVLRLSDDIFTGAHKVNLEAHSDRFLRADSIEDMHEPVDLTEMAEILNHLMHGMHKAKFGLLAMLSCNTVFALGEAAEKYVV